MRIGFVSSFFLIWCSTNRSVRSEVEQTAIPVPQVERQQTIFALWDSLTAWYQLPLEESYPMQLDTLLDDQTVINWWKSWETSSGLLQNVARITAEAQPWDIAVVTIWGNDWLQSLPVEQLESNLREIIDIVVAKELSVVVWWMQLPTNFNPVYRKQFTWLYDRVVNQYDQGVTVIPFLLEGVGGQKNLNLQDWIHPNKEWYGVVAQTVYEHLLQEWLLDD